jgi:hypothetical protein
VVSCRVVTFDGGDRCWHVGVHFEPLGDEQRHLLKILIAQLLMEQLGV